MRVENVLVGIVAMASLSLARPWHNTSSVAYGTGLIGTAPVGTAPVSAGFTSATYTNSSSTKYFQSTSTLATGYGPAVTANGLSDPQAAGVFSSLPSSADGCSVTYATVFASQATETPTSTETPITTDSPATTGESSSVERYSYAINSGTTSWIDGMSPPASEYSSTASESTTVVVTPSSPATTKSTVSTTSDSATLSVPAAASSSSSSSSSDSTSVSIVTATAFSTTTVNLSASTESSTLSPLDSPASSSSSSDEETITKTAFSTRTITRTKPGVSTRPTTDDIATANITSWQWASLTGPTTAPSVSVTLTANTTAPVLIIPTITESVISPSTITVTASDFPSLSPSGSEGLSFTGVLSPQTSATISLSTSSTKASPVIPASSTEDSPVIASSSGTAPVTYTPSSTGNAVSTVHPSSSLSSYSGTGVSTPFGTAVSSTYISSPTGNLVSPTHTANATTPCESSTKSHLTPVIIHPSSSSTANPSSTEASPALSSQSSSSSYNYTSTSTSWIYSLTLASSTSTLSALYTPVVSATTTQSTAAPSSTACGEVGNYTINWDDEPLFVPPKNSNTSLFPPVFSPYHHLFYANGFAYVAPPADGLKEPFPATSNPNIAIFMPDLVIDATAKNHSVIKFTGLLPGEISASPRASDEIWEFDAYGADLGCDNVGPGLCTMTITGYAYDTTTQSEFAVAQQKVELPPCDTATLHNCSLKHVDLEGFHGLSGIQFEALVGGQQKIFVMDNLNLGWCDNSCSAGLKRFNFGKN